MTEVGRAAALALAAVFAWAGAAKLAGRQTTAASFHALGLPRARALSVVVPAVELGLAAVVLIEPAIGGVALVLVLVAFTAVLARALHRGLDVRCACFGAATDDPISSTQVARNVALAVGAVVATQSDGVLWPGVPALVTVTTAAMVIRVALAVGDLRRHGPLWPSTPGGGA